VAVGLKEIAKDLDLGLSTVAQALTGRGTISPRTRQLVAEHAARVGYTPNRNAQRMRSARTGAIGLVVPDVVLSPYVEVVQHLFRMIEEKGKEMQLALTEFNPALESRAMKSMLAARVDGIIAKVGFARWEDVPADHYLRRAKSEGTPVVLYSNPIEGSDMPYMKHPVFASVKLVVRHLVGLGHHRIGALVPAVRPFGPAMQLWLTALREELALYREVQQLEIIGMPPGQGSVEGPLGVFRDYMNQNHPQHAVPAGRSLLNQAMDRPIPPTALIAYSDPVAIGAVFEAQSRGMRVGRDVAIAGCGQISSSFFCPASLTTVDRRPQLYAQKLHNLLEMHMDETKRAHAPACDAVEPLLVIGNSTTGA